MNDTSKNKEQFDEIIKHESVNDFPDVLYDDMFREGFITGANRGYEYALQQREEPSHISGQGELKWAGKVEFVVRREGAYLEDDIQYQLWIKACKWMYDYLWMYGHIIETPSPSREVELEKCLGELVEAYQSERSISQFLLDKATGYLI